MDTISTEARDEYEARVEAGETLNPEEQAECDLYDSVAAYESYHDTIHEDGD